jgi:UDP-N-acetylglucosamine--N-acetylmuramyl-(pentapeptide) pyrophosphoryl-undecaprenol N-acetylglucosamine transferase
VEREKEGNRTMDKQEKDPKRIIIAGGGTGGHIFPALAIAQSLQHQEPATELLFIGARGKMEMEKIPQAGYRIEGIDIAGFNRSSLIKNIGLPFKILKSFRQVRKIFRDFHPVAVIGVGGYSTYPVLRYAQARGIPTFIHEANSFAGKTNIMLGKKVRKAFVASEGMQRFFPAHSIFRSGNPVRRRIADSRITREEGIRFFGLDPSKKTVLVVGGSLGAKSINQAIANGLELLESAGIQLIWQTGKPYLAEAKDRAAQSPLIWVNDFIGEMEYAFAAGDLVVARAGAMTIAELSVCGKPAILVPYPFASEDHQTANASGLVKEGAAVMIRDSEAWEKLVSTLIGLIGNERIRNEMGQNMARMGVRNADEVIATEILKEIHD